MAVSKIVDHKPNTRDTSLTLPVRDYIVMEALEEISGLN